jgi:prepilin peptidase CpaA
MGFGSWVGALYGASEGGWTIVWAVCAGMIAGGVIGLAMMALRSQFDRNAKNFREILTDLRLMVTAGPKVAAARAQARRPNWHRLPYGIPLCIGFVGYLVYLHWFYGG